MYYCVCSISLLCYVNIQKSTSIDAFTEGQHRNRHPSFAISISLWRSLGNYAFRIYNIFLVTILMIGYHDIIIETMLQRQLAPPKSEELRVTALLPPHRELAMSSLAPHLVEQLQTLEFT